MPDADIDRSEHEDAGDRRRSRGSEDAVEVIAASTVRVALLILGLLLLAYATGQVLGLDVLAMISETLDTPEARWLLVAFLALVLIALALRGFE